MPHSLVVERHDPSADASLLAAAARIRCRCRRSTDRCVALGGASMSLPGRSCPSPQTELVARRRHRPHHHGRWLATVRAQPASTRSRPGQRTLPVGADRVRRAGAAQHRHRLKLAWACGKWSCAAGSPRRSVMSTVWQPQRLSRGPLKSDVNLAYVRVFRESTRLHEKTLRRTRKQQRTAVSTTKADRAGHQPPLLPR